MILSDRSSKFSLLRDLKRHLKISVPSTQKLECVYTCNLDHFHSLGKPLWSFHVGSRLSLTFDWYNFENIFSCPKYQQEPNIINRRAINRWGTHIFRQILHQILCVLERTMSSLLGTWILISTISLRSCCLGKDYLITPYPWRNSQKDFLILHFLRHKV